MTPRENMKNFFSGKPYEWRPLAADRKSFHPQEISDYVARAFVFQQEPFNNRTQSGGIGWFNVEWVYEPTVGGSMDLKPLWDDISEWRDNLVVPDLEAIDWEGIAKKNADFLNTDKIISATVFTGYFERLISLVGFENAAMALFDEDEQKEVHDLFRVLTDFYIAYVKKINKYWNVEFVTLHDDWGSQRAPFFSPATHKEMIFPYVKEFVDACHELGIIVEMHSCGDITGLIPNLIETGVDTWSGQGICDKKALVDKYGDQFKFEVIVRPTPEMNVDEAIAYCDKIMDQFAGQDVCYWEGVRYLKDPEERARVNAHIKAKAMVK